MIAILINTDVDTNIKVPQSPPLGGLDISFKNFYNAQLIHIYFCQIRNISTGPSLSRNVLFGSENVDIFGWPLNMLKLKATYQ